MSNPQFALGDLLDDVYKKCNEMQGGARRNALRRFNKYRDRYVEDLSETIHQIPNPNVSPADIALNIVHLEKTLMKGFLKDFGITVEAEWELRKRQLVEFVLKERNEFYRDQLTDQENELRDKSSDIRIEILNSAKKGVPAEEIIQNYMEEAVRFATEWNEVITDPDRQAIVPDLNDPSHRTYLRDEVHHHIRSAMLGSFDPKEFRSIDETGDLMNERIKPIIEENLHKSDDELLEDCLTEIVMIVSEINAKYDVNHRVPELDDPMYLDMMQHNINVSRQKAKE